MKKENGSALIYVLVVLVVLSILGVAVLNASVAETKNGIYLEKNVKAYYAARAGVDAMAKYIIENPDELQNIIIDTQTNPAKGSFGTTALGEVADVEFEVQVEGNIDSFVIHSIGKYKADSNFSKESYALIEVFDFSDMGLLADQDVTLGINQGIAGGLGSNSGIISGGAHITLDQSITLGFGATNNFAGNYASSDLEENILIGSIIDFAEIKQQIEEAFNDHPPVSVMGDNTIVSIPASEEYVQWDGQGVLEIQGTGIVHVLISNTLLNYELSIANIINNDNSKDSNIDVPKAKLTVYSTKAMTFTMPSGNSEFAMNIIAPEADFKMGNGGGNAEFMGVMLVKEFTGSNSHASFTTFPTGTLDDFLIDRVYSIKQRSDN